MSWKTDEETKIEEEFDDIIQNKMTDDQFWVWIREWYAVEDLVETAINWDTEVKKDELEHLREIIKNNK